ncbi:hypothetical protein [Ruegeria sp. AU67]|uniref:hypothetical protein n=1 Tax=Ruegeria sp. AU67 TaxID=2108530 RepID=UPI000D688C9A|nr:hypothetical protein [Ruegeria sp. AU67]
MLSFAAFALTSALGSALPFSAVSMIGRSQPNAGLVDPEAERRAGIGAGNYLGLIYRNFFSNRYMKVELI